MYVGHALEGLAQGSAALPASKTVATLQGLPPGRAATVGTLRAMRDLARGAVRSPSQTIREHALRLVKFLPARDWTGQVAVLLRFVQTQIRYTRDPAGVELVQTPEKTLEYGQGDCDDKCTLLAAMLESLGHPTRYVALGIRGRSFSHVICETKIGTRWVALETILNKPIGWSPPDATSKYILKV